jgi:hypothetical protein
MPDGTTHITPSKAVNYTDFGQPLFKEIAQIEQPRPDIVRIDDTPVFGNIARYKYNSQSKEDIVEFTNRFADNFHPADVTSNLTLTILIISILLVVLGLAYYCRKHKIGCCCNKQRRHRLPNAPPAFNELPPDALWFPDDDREPDTISGIAARRTPQRNSMFLAPARNLQRRVQSWTTSQENIQTRPRTMTSDQLNNEQMRAMLQNPSMPQRPRSMENILDDGQVPRPIIKNHQLQSPDLARLQQEQEQMMRQHQHEPRPIVRPHSPPSHVSFTPETSSAGATAFINRPQSQTFPSYTPNIYITGP